MNHDALGNRLKQEDSIQRNAKNSPAAAEITFQTVGAIDRLPVFAKSLAERMQFPFSWLSGNYRNFPDWRKAARDKLSQCLLNAPPFVSFNPVTIAELDRGTYIARKVIFNLTADSRVLAYLLIPKGQGPFPGVLLLHDHGARFDIGKEKLIEPFADSEERMASAKQYIRECYGNRFIGDELAKRGYVCLATDMLNWSDRWAGGFDAQESLSCNLLHLGYSYAGLIAHEDSRAAAFLCSLPEVDTRFIAALGLSVGCFRTWQLCALTDIVKAGVAICWMATVKGLMVPGNNQTTGQSAYTMVHPDLFNYLDYPDVAGIACPKPMLFYNGTHDHLFPVESVQQAYAKMRRIWQSQGATDKLETKIWPIPHEFNFDMQEEAFAWLARQLKAMGLRTE